MTKEQYALLGAKLTQSYKTKVRDSKSGGVGLIRVITGTEESDQGYIHLEELYIRDNKITLKNYLDTLEVNLGALEHRIDELNETYKARLIEKDKEIQNLNKKIEEIVDILAEIDLSTLE